MKKLCLLALLLTGCGGSSKSNVKVIVGAHLPSKQLEYSVIVIEDGKIVDVGAQSDIPVPKGAEITSGMGKTIEPGPGVTIERGQPASLQLRNEKTLAVEKLMIDGAWK